MNMVPYAARLEAGARPLPSAGDTASALVQAATTLAAALAKAEPSTPAPYAPRWRRLRRLGQRWRVGVEGRLRGGRGRPGSVPAPLRLRHAGQGRHACGYARHARPGGGAPADPDPPLRGEPSPPAILNPSAARFRGERRGGADARRRRARALGRDRAVGDLRRTRGRNPGAERARPDARRSPRTAVRDGAGLAAQRRTDPRPPPGRGSAERGVDEPAVLGVPEHRGPGCGRGAEACRLGAGPPGRGWAVGRHHGREPCP